MEIAKIQVSGVSAKVVYQSVVPAGIVGATISVEYTDPAWEEFSRTVVFTGCVTKDVLSSDNTVTVPAEVVAKPGSELFVSFYGVGKNKKLAVPTLRVSLGKITPAANPSGDSSTNPALPVWAQLQQDVDALKENGTGTAGATYFPAVSDDGTLSWTNDKGLENPPPVVIKGDPGNDYVLTESDKTEIAEIAADLVEVPEGNVSLFPLTFTGAINASYDGSQAVNINVPVAGGTPSIPRKWTYIDTIDLSSGALSYEIDTAGYTEIMIVNLTACTHAGSAVQWKNEYKNTAGVNFSLQKTNGTVCTFHYLGNGVIAFFNGRSSDTLLMGGAATEDVVESNNTLKLTFTSVTSGTIAIAGRV